jgi:hypothetical protein
LGPLDIDRRRYGISIRVSPEHRRYLVLEQGIGSGVFNLALNAAIAWLMFRGAATVPLWGQQSIAGDTLGTAFMLPLLTTLIASRVVRGHVRRGRVPAMAWPVASLGQHVPRRLGMRGAILGVVCLVAVALPATQALAAAGVAEMTLGRFVVFKALFAAGLAVVVTPLIARAALADGAAPAHPRAGAHAPGV